VYQLIEQIHEQHSLINVGKQITQVRMLQVSYNFTMRRNRDYEDDHRRKRGNRDDYEHQDRYSSREGQRRGDTRRNYDGRARYNSRREDAPQKFFDEDVIERNSEVPPQRNGIPIWNFSDDIPYNIVVKEGTNQIPKIPILPELEYRRAQELVALRSEYERDCVSILYGMGAPKESFNRWLFEQLAIPKSSINTEVLDPLLCNPEISEKSDVIKAELVAEIPARIRYRYPKQARISLANYLREGRSWLSKLKHLEQSRKEDFSKATRYLSDAQHWLNNMSSYADESQLDAYKKQLDILKNECSPLFHVLVHDNVTQVCQRLARNAREVIEKIAKINIADLKSQPVTITCASQIVTVTYGDKLDHFNMNVSHYNKLRCLYRKHNECPDDWEKSFQDRLYVLLRRYQTFFGPSDLEGGNFHAALPESGFDLLRKTMSVSQECFASPFNCYFSRFCSAFPDTDVFFGSRGSFFDFEPIEGSFECGPPYTVEVMDRTAEHCISLLKKTDLPLSFIVFVPEWTDTNYGRLMDPANCDLCVDHFLADKENHKYVTGLQHLAVNTVEKTNQRYWTLPFPTHVYFLQNEKGREKWPVKDVIGQLKRVMERS
jgi:phosphorylated CTD-interacting factor 1